MLEREYMNSLAISMQAVPGFYALLLGSGLSSSARIPTGWGITLHLLRKLALLSGNSEISISDEALISWYAHKSEREQKPTTPSYSALLSELFEEPVQRDLALKQYFEATDDERLELGEDYKAPTPAHRAIARLMKQGYIRLVLTTNFDRLLENALLAENVEPAAVTYSQIASLKPIHCYDHLIIKLHGDYQISELLNTEQELAKYKSELQQILYDVFRDYKWIICGWSAQYDKALVDCIRDAKRKWVPLWLDNRELGDISLTVANSINAETHIIASGADSFFTELEEKVMAIESITAPVPSSPEIAVAVLKRYLGGHLENIIRANDIIINTAREANEQIDSISLPLSFPKGSGDSTITEPNRRLLEYDLATNKILALLAVATRWYKPSLQSAISEAICMLLTEGTRFKCRGANNDLLSLSYYPALRCYYGIGLIAFRQRELGLLTQIWNIKYKSIDSNRKKYLIHDLYTYYVMDNDFQKIIERHGRSRTPLSDYIKYSIQPIVSEIISNQSDYDDFFDAFEFACGLASGIHYNSKESFGSWIGSFLKKFGKYSDQPGADEIESIVIGEDGWLLKTGMFGSSLSELREYIALYKQFLEAHRYL